MNPWDHRRAAKLLYQQIGEILERAARGAISFAEDHLQLERQAQDHLREARRLEEKRKPRMTGRRARGPRGWRP